MANPRPGDPDYVGPVGEGWGRPTKNFIDDLNSGLEGLLQSGRDAVGGVEQSIRDGLDPTTWGIFRTEEAPKPTYAPTSAPVLKTPKRTRTRSTSRSKSRSTSSRTRSGKTGSNKRTRQVGRVAAKVQARSGGSAKASRAKARKIIKKRK